MFFLAGLQSGSSEKSSNPNQTTWPVVSQPALRAGGPCRKSGKLVQFYHIVKPILALIHDISVRPSRDFINVTVSAYSISAPTGNPLANRVTLTFRGLRTFPI